MTKQVYTWAKVKAGDIISFRYKGKKAVTGALTTVLVMNPRIPYMRKDNVKSFHLVGLKLEYHGTIPTIRNKPKLVELLERVGDVVVVDLENQIYRVNLIPNPGPRGVKKNVYHKLKQYIARHSVYRTYDYMKAKKSAVFLEPISFPREFREYLEETIED